MKFDPRKLVRLKRPRYFQGQLLTAEDLRAEQQYHLDRQWQHNRLLHGYGIVVGLEVATEQAANGSTRVIVSPGFALDGWGRELVVNEPLSVFLPGDRHDLTLYLKYIEQDDEQSDPGTTASARRADAVIESAQLSFEPSPSEHALGAAGRADFAIPIARLRRPHREWQRDKNFRPPRAK
ncbi:MAG: hypothetical protein IT331_19480 [Anaerolineae bacterium]|nr:hypothetical protein [Anaerolineae bacterium]